jgi:large subunit ribosomal protein L3
MTLGLIGKKCGMTRIFTDEGTSIPVTVVEIPAKQFIIQIKTPEKDGYQALQVTVDECKPNRVSKPMAGHYAKANVAPGRRLHEFRLPAGTDLSQYTLGQALTPDLFKVGQKVDVVGTSKGKGFAGVIKRHHFAMQDATHGNSLSHRAHGSIGQNQSPGKVFKGKKMAGHLGSVRRTMQNLEVVKVDLERGLLLIRGSVPGAINGDLVIRPAVKIKGADDAA